MALHGRVAIVVGGSGGIGVVTVRALVSAGATVVVAAMGDSRLDAIAAELAGTSPASFVVATDIRSRTDIDRAVAMTIVRFGRIDALVNAAGVGSRPVFTDEEDADLERILAVNLLGCARTMHAVLPIMKAQRRGAIVNIGSVAGEIGLIGMYSASKFGLRGLTDSLRREVRSDGIRITLVEPGFVQTPMNPAYPPLPPPEIVADAVVRAIMHPKRRMVVPRRYLPAVVIAGAFPGLIDAVFGNGSVRRRLHKGVSDAPPPTPQAPPKGVHSNGAGSVARQH
jgi:NAD(P)-dependent dehydrogenase (short-subunit alcohol dehydrogenase family)